MDRIIPNPNPVFGKSIPAADAIVHKILVVDSDDVASATLSQILSSKGYKVLTVKKGHDALRLFDAHHFDLVISDVYLPDASGLKLLHYCKHKQPDVEVILITGKPLLTEAVTVVKAGAFSYLAKPIGAERLLKEVKTALLKAPHKVGENALTSTTLLKNVPASEYRIIRSLGAGSIGTVLLVEKEGTFYAMKILRFTGDQKIDPKLLRRFLQEAELLSRFNHPGIVKVIELGFEPTHGSPYIIMEHIAGASLSALIAGQKLTLEEKLDIVYQIAMTLDTVHREGIQHRDIKPSNIMVTLDNQAKITDFGIARLGGSHLTLSLEVLGSPAYMAPESYSGSQEVDLRSDLFSFGVLTYELLTGGLPFQADTIPAMAHIIANEKPVAPCRRNPQLPVAVEALIGRMLQKSPQERYQKAEEIVTHLHLLRQNPNTSVSAVWPQYSPPHTWQDSPSIPGMESISNPALPTRPE